MHMHATGPQRRNVKLDRLFAQWITPERYDIVRADPVIANQCGNVVDLVTLQKDYFEGVETREG